MAGTHEKRRGELSAAANSAALHPTAQQICAQAGISRRMFFLAVRVKEEGCEELNKAVRDGTVSMNLAVNLLTFDHAGQRLILAEFPTMKQRDRTGFVEIVRAVRLQEIAND